MSVLRAAIRLGVIFSALAASCDTGTPPNRGTWQKAELVPRENLTVSQIARPRAMPAGVPHYSDVWFSTRRPQYEDDSDPRNIFSVARSFHATRMNWIDASEKEFFKKASKSGFAYIGARAGLFVNLPADADADDNPAAHGLITKLDGKAFRRIGGAVVGCVNNPVFRNEIWMQSARQKIGAGAVGLASDAAQVKVFSSRWVPCYCDYCSVAFREYLQWHISSRQLKEWGITDLDEFDFRVHLRNCPESDLSKALQVLLIPFYEESLERFFKEMRAEINAYAGRHVPFSVNNGSTQGWPDYMEVFDFGFAEMSMPSANPEHLYARSAAARRLGKAQIFHAPKSNEPMAAANRRLISRKIIATTYAVGAHTVVPWDVFMGIGFERYYGEPEEYADLYGFIRANAKYFDGYEEAAVIGADNPVNASQAMIETRYGSNLPVKIEGGSEKVYAFIRAKPGHTSAPVVIHLVEWADTPQACTIKLRRENFFRDKSHRANLLVPTTYSRANHEKTEADAERMRTRGDSRGPRQAPAYAMLSTSIAAMTFDDDAFITVKVPPLNPWGLLIISLGEPNLGLGGTIMQQ